MRTITVSELNNIIKNNIEENIKYVKIEGEVTNMRESRGHVYITMKDKETKINAVCWNYEKKKIKIEDGMKVIIEGKISYYEKTGSININIYKMKVIGEGELYKKYIKIKEEYEKKGYFKKEGKKEIKELNKIGILTAKDGAAIKDIMKVLKDNGYYGEIRIMDSKVQGINCAVSISKNIRKMDKMGLDLILISRGGGSYEELFGFSDKLIIEAIYEAKTCIMSAIGHERDNMLSDYVADIRAATPSVAGEIISKRKNRENEKRKIEEKRKEEYIKILKRKEKIKEKIKEIKRKNKYEERIKGEKEKIEEIKGKTKNIIIKKKNRILEKYNRINKIIKKNSIKNNIKIYHNKKIINSIKEIQELQENKTNKKLKIKLSDGILLISVKKIKISNGK